MHTNKRGNVETSSRTTAITGSIAIAIVTIVGATASVQFLEFRPDFRGQDHLEVKPL